MSKNTAIKKKSNKKMSTYEKIDVAHKIIMGILTIVATVYLGIQGHWLVERQLDQDKQETAPSMNFRLYKEDGLNKYELTNSKGHMSNVTFEKIDQMKINFHAPSVYIPYNITYEILSGNTDDTETPKNCYLYIPAVNNYDVNKYVKLLENKINEKINSEMTVTVYARSYYRVSYTDYKNEYHKEFYLITDLKNGKAKFDGDLEKEDYTSIDNSKIGMRFPPIQTEYKDTDYEEDAERTANTVLDSYLNWKNYRYPDS